MIIFQTILYDSHSMKNTEGLICFYLMTIPLNGFEENCDNRVAYFHLPLYWAYGIPL